ncbi:hypothetical protein AB0N16_34450 [Streptomyces sp. NPDC051105]|uniref:hypothetical protein n=1 Tax=Streptomyces sp. NPDC051105 TaxID=3154843 RepID=UPI0034144AB5
MTPVRPALLTAAQVRRVVEDLIDTGRWKAGDRDRPGPGRPPGSKDRHPATRYDVGKTARRPETIKERDQVRS